MRILLQQPGDAHDEAGRTIAAHQCVLVHERLLHFAELPVFREAFDGRDFFALRIDRQHRTGINRFIVDQHGARAARGAIAHFLRTGQRRMIAQRFEQRHARFEFELERFAIHLERDGNRFRPVEFFFVSLLEFGGGFNLWLNDLVALRLEARDISWLPKDDMTSPKSNDLVIGAGQAGLDEYATILYLEKIGLVPNKDVQLVYLAGGVPSRAAAMKQGLIDGVAVNPPNEYELEKAGYRELANFLDLQMPYAGVPHTVTRAFRDKNRKVVEDYMTGVIEGMQIFRTNREKAYRAIFELTRQKDPVLLERTYDSYMRQYDAIGGVPFPWEAGTGLSPWRSPSCRAPGNARCAGR